MRTCVFPSQNSKHYCEAFLFEKVRVSRIFGNPIVSDCNSLIEAKYNDESDQQLRSLYSRMRETDLDIDDLSSFAKTVKA